MQQDLIIQFEDNSHINKFLKNFKDQKEQFLQTIINRYKEYASLNKQKIKVIPKIKHLNNSVFEFKVPLNFSKYKDVRVAYILDHKTNTLTIFYITNNIIKKNFVKELTNTNLID